MAKKKGAIRKVVEAVEGWVGMKPKKKAAKKKTAKKSLTSSKSVKKAKKKGR